MMAEFAVVPILTRPTGFHCPGNVAGSEMSWNGLGEASCEAAGAARPHELPLSKIADAVNRHAKERLKKLMPIMNQYGLNCGFGG